MDRLYSCHCATPSTPLRHTYCFSGENLLGVKEVIEFSIEIGTAAKPAGLALSKGFLEDRSMSASIVKPGGSQNLDLQVDRPRTDAGTDFDRADHDLQLEKGLQCGYLCSHCLGGALRRDNGSDRLVPRPLSGRSKRMEQRQMDQDSPQVAKRRWVATISLEDVARCSQQSNRPTEGWTIGTRQ